MSNKNNSIVEVMQIATREVGELIMSHFRLTKRFDSTYKDSQADLVTKVDIESQKLLKELISNLIIARGLIKEIGFLGEENLNIPKDHLFILDPIDGTTNFATGLSYFCISIAYAYKGIVVAGVVYDPVARTMYTSIKGNGTSVLRKTNKTILKIVPIPLKDCLVCGHHNVETIKDLFSIYIQLIPKVRGNRSMGSLILDLCQTAEGVFNIVINGNCYIWDLAASMLIIEESGGIITDWQGKKISLDFSQPKKPYKIIATAPENLPELLKCFRDV